jgi:hypothetical protein
VSQYEHFTSSQIWSVCFRVGSDRDHNVYSLSLKVSALGYTSVHGLWVVKTDVIVYYFVSRWVTITDGVLSIRSRTTLVKNSSNIMIRGGTTSAITLPISSSISSISNSNNIVTTSPVILILHHNMKGSRQATLGIREVERRRSLTQRGF